jgi:hypothetical protein
MNRKPFNPPADSNEGQSSPNGWIDIHALRVLMFSNCLYMNGQPNHGLELNPAWSPVFAQLCSDIDALLGPDKRGFHWRRLSQEDGKPLWCWRLERQLDLFVGFTVEQGELGITVINPVGDPDNRLRESIRALVDAAMLRAGELRMDGSDSDSDSQGVAS